MRMPPKTHLFDFEHEQKIPQWDENKINSNINVLMEQIIKTYKEIKVINAELNNLYGIII